MILRATLRNILSFNEETQISFVAGKGSMHPLQVVRAKRRDDISVLKAGMVYGANASGKSNLIKAVSFLKRLVNGESPLAELEKFKSSIQKPVSKLELEIKIGGRYFAYGVEYSRQAITEEWLYEINNRTEFLIYERQTTPEGNVFSFGNRKAEKAEKNFLDYLAKATPVNKTFISEYCDRNGSGLEEIVLVRNWFLSNLKIIFPDTRYRGLSIRAEKDEDFQKVFRQLLRHFNTGIIDIRLFPVASKEETGLSKSLIDRVISNGKPGDKVVMASSSGDEVFFFEFNENGEYGIFKQKAVHESGGNEILFEMNEESDGTVRLLDFIPMLIDLQRNPSVYLIDELDRSMHPNMTYELLSLYLSNLSKEVDSQLIFTTHESNLLNMELVRADEVWFVEKDKVGGSRFTSLAEYKPRTDVRKGYLLGRYQAIPFFANPRLLNWK